MAIFITGDTHGDFSRLLPAAFHEQRDLTKEDYLILCGDFGGVWDGGDAELLLRIAAIPDTAEVSIIPNSGQWRLYRKKYYPEIFYIALKIQ